MAQAMLYSDMAIGKAVPKRSREETGDDKEFVEMCSRKKRRTLVMVANPRETCLGQRNTSSQMPRKTSAASVAPKLPPEDVLQRIRDRSKQAGAQIGKAVILSEPPKKQKKKN